MGKEIIKDIADLNKYLDKIECFDDACYIELKNLSIDIEFIISFESISEWQYKANGDKFANNDAKVILQIENCDFNEAFKVYYHNSLCFEFNKCHFKNEFSVTEIDFFGKLKFGKCTFNEVNFFNTVLDDLADFYKCTFNKKVIFNKTDFLGTTVFAACTFKENVLFTYSLIEKLLILRGSEFQKGLDLSLSIGEGEINFFDMELNEYNATPIDSKIHPDKYNDYVTEKGIIPLINKRETFRIIKHTLVSQNNVSESIYYKMLEKKTLKNEVKINLKNKKGSEYIDSIFDWINLKLNECSNKYGSSYLQAFGFTVIVGGFFFYLTAVNSKLYSFAWCFYPDAFFSSLKYFVQFLLPIHGYDYLGKGDQTFWFYFFDFLGRVFVGYGIYQFIQAFRKYR